MIITEEITIKRERLKILVDMNSIMAIVAINTEEGDVEEDMEGAEELEGEDIILIGTIEMIGMMRSITLIAKASMKLKRIQHIQATKNKIMKVKILKI